MKCLFLASPCTDAAAMTYRGISQATSNWVAGLMQGIKDAGGEVTALSHVHDTLWPKGRMFPGQTEDLNASVDATLVKYGNFPGLRNSWLSVAIVRAAGRHIKEHGRPDVLLTYNLYPYYVEAARAISRKYGIPWIPIILDLDDPEADNWAAFLRDSAASRGSIFLSWWGYSEAPCSPKLHLDSGGSAAFTNRDANQKSPKNVVYAGKFSGYGGIQLLADVISSVEKKDVNFVLCGKGDASILQKQAKTDSRIDFKGFISDVELVDICHRADIFLNPRPPDNSDNRMVFPSKILYYLSYGVPVVSTWTEGLSEDYRDVLIVPPEDGAEAFARSVEEVLNWSDAELQSYRDRVAQFLAGKSWATQGKRLMEFAGQVIEGK